MNKVTRKIDKKNETTARAKLDFVSIDDLIFDPKNPRLPENLHGETEAAVISYMLDDASLQDLMNSIGEQDYFPGEPLLVYKSSTKGKFEVGEGNRRLAAVKLLSNPDLASTKKSTVKRISAAAKHKPSELPVLIYEDRKQILHYLGYRHITGVKQWDALAKARYMKQLFDDDNLRDQTTDVKFKSVAKTIGSRSNYVGKILTGLKIYETIKDQDYFEIPGINERSIDFSILTSALSYSGIAAYIGLSGDQDYEAADLDIDHVKDVTSWFFEDINYGTEKKRRTALGESRNLSSLNDILKSGGQALSMFRAGSPISDAAVYTDEPRNVLISLLDSARLNLDSAEQQIKHVTKTGDSEVNLITVIEASSKDLKLAIARRTPDSQ